jgi:hypothetical protein
MAGCIACVPTSYWQTAQVAFDRIDPRSASSGGTAIYGVSSEWLHDAVNAGSRPEPNRNPNGNRPQRDTAATHLFRTGDNELGWAMAAPCGKEVKIDGVLYLIMKESDVMGVLTDTDARRKAA